MFNRTIPPFTHSLQALSKILDKAEAYCTERKIDPSVLLTDRLFPDMLPFTRQIQIATDHARRAAARLAGVEPLAIPDTETSFAELKDRIARSVETLATFTPDQFKGAETRQITVPIGGGRTLDMTGEDYLSRMAIPNFYFHMTTAHCILRSNGVGIGKADFLGG